MLDTSCAPRRSKTCSCAWFSPMCGSASTQCTTTKRIGIVAKSRWLLASTVAAGTHNDTLLLLFVSGSEREHNLVHCQQHSRRVGLTAACGHFGNSNTPQPDDATCEGDGGYGHIVFELALLLFVNLVIIFRRHPTRALRTQPAIDDCRRLFDSIRHHTLLNCSDTLMLCHSCCNSHNHDSSSARHHNNS